MTQQFGRCRRNPRGRLRLRFRRRRSSSTGWPVSSSFLARMRKTEDVPNASLGLPAAEHKVRGPRDAKRGPQVVQCESLLHVQHGKRDKHREGNNFLQNLELPKLHHGDSGPVSGYLEHVFKERNPPAHQHRDKPRLRRQVPEVSIPCKCHKDVTACQKQDGDDVGSHVVTRWFLQFSLVEGCRTTSNRADSHFVGNLASRYLRVQARQGRHIPCRGREAPDC
jgi:hypothetical protein